MTTPQHPVRQAGRLYHDLLSPAETLEVRDRARKIAADVVAPAARRIANGDERVDGFPREVFDGLADAGLFRVPFAAEVGGEGLAHPAYTMATYGMTLLTLGWAAEYAEHGVAANCLWPETYIATDAVKNILGGESAMERSRTPEIVADAAIAVLERPARECTGNTFLDVEVLRDAGVTDLSPYGGTGDLAYDIFVDPPRRPATSTTKPTRESPC